MEIVISLNDEDFDEEGACGVVVTAHPAQKVSGEQMKCDAWNLKTGPMWYGAHYTEKASGPAEGVEGDASPNKPFINSPGAGYDGKEPRVGPGSVKGATQGRPAQSDTHDNTETLGDMPSDELAKVHAHYNSIIEAQEKLRDECVSIIRGFASDGSLDTLPWAAAKRLLQRLDKGAYALGIDPIGFSGIRITQDTVVPDIRINGKQIMQDAHYTPGRLQRDPYTPGGEIRSTGSVAAAMDDMASEDRAKARLKEQQQVHAHNAELAGTYEKGHREGFRKAEKEFLATPSPSEQFAQFHSVVDHLKNELDMAKDGEKKAWAEVNALRETTQRASNEYQSVLNNASKQIDDLTRRLQRIQLTLPQSHCVECGQAHIFHTRGGYVLQGHEPATNHPCQCRESCIDKKHSEELHANG